MHKTIVLIFIALGMTIGAVFLSGCPGGCPHTIVEPPRLTLDEPNYDTPGGDPSEWDSDMSPDVAKHMTYDAPRLSADAVPGGSPGDWGSGEPVMNDGTVPGQPRHGTYDAPRLSEDAVGGSPSDWGSGEAIMNDGTTPSDHETPPSEFDRNLEMSRRWADPFYDRSRALRHIKFRTNIDDLNEDDEDTFDYYFHTSKPRLSSRLGWSFRVSDPLPNDIPRTGLDTTQLQIPRNFRPGLNWLTDDVGKPRFPLNPSTAHQAGLGDLDFTGKNNSAGDIFDMRFTNYSGFNLQLQIPFGSFINPTDSEYQRMTITDGLFAECPDNGMTTSIPLKGFCADPGKYPPAPQEDEPTLGWTINPSLFRLEKLGGGMTEIPPPKLSLDAGDDAPLPACERYTLSPEFRMDPFFGNYLTAPLFPKTAERLVDEGQISIPGFSAEKTKKTVSQWGYWYQMSHFTIEDSREKIDKMTEGNPNITPPMKEEVNQSAWDAIDLTAKETKKAVQQTQQGTTDNSMFQFEYLSPDDDDLMQFRYKIHF